MAREMKKRGIIPAMIFCSSAVRAQETLAPFRKVFPKAQVRIVPDIYESNNASFLFSLCETVPDSVGTLLMIGHVPGVSSLAGALANPEKSDPDALKEIALSFAPCSLAVLDIRDPWNALSYDSGALRAFIPPSTFLNSSAQESSLKR